MGNNTTSVHAVGDYLHQPVESKYLCLHTVHFWWFQLSYSFVAHFSTAVPSSGRYAKFTNCTTCFLLYSMP